MEPRRRRGALSRSISTPSIRYRIRTRSANGSMWMSLARCCTASWMMRCTSRMTGASPSSRVLVEPDLPPRRPVLGEVDRRVGELLEHRVDRLGLRRGAAVVLVDRLDDRFLGRERDLDLAIQHEPELVDRLEIERVVHDDTDDPAVLGQGHDDVFAREGFGDELDDGGGDLDLVELDEGQAVLLGLCLHDIVGIGVAQADQRLLDGAAGGAAGFLELIGTDHAAPDQDFGPIPTLGHD